MGTRCRDELIRMIREAGLELIDRGETMIPEGAEGITNKVQSLTQPPPSSDAPSEALGDRRGELFPTLALNIQKGYSL